ncbi:rhodanese-like domain-containing protein [Ferviditalea candida]|uniref:Rhodanese-like domain-containing protein n=1 Tax=Ferviditalea candida TaxID=3108399 RepID=A0ABU5ZLK9_9BACL|nr:rhodanese-like domain-containing protein [Paenibacillaceae bacterium T2]
MAKYRGQSPQEVLDRLRRKAKFRILDVREPEEWLSGHIPGAIHIPMGQITQRLEEIDPDEELIVVCRSGNRSGMVCDYLSERGYNVVNMSGGMMAWPGEVEFDD